MLYSFQNTNVGPMVDSQLQFGGKLNVFTGDNSTGKSFLLDLIWFGIARCWPAEINGDIKSGFPARPWTIRQPATIKYAWRNDKSRETCSFSYRKIPHHWQISQENPPIPYQGLVVYMMADGSFAVFDPLRNGKIGDAFSGKGSHLNAYLLSPNELWPSENSSRCAFCNGVLADWAAWQRDIDQSLFTYLKSVVETLCLNDEAVEFLPLDRLPTELGGDQPVLKLKAGRTRLKFASSSVRRMAALAYVLVWTVSEHLHAAKELGVDPTPQIFLLVDEIDAHLHPHWQRECVSKAVSAVEKLCELSGYGNPHVQAFISTHSPLVMASLEDAFYKWNESPEVGQSIQGTPNCKWFDFDVAPSRQSDDGRNVIVQERSFEPQGSAEGWLTSEAFNLKPTALYSPEVEKSINELNDAFEDYQKWTATISTKDATQAPKQLLAEKVHALTSRLHTGDVYGYIFDRKLHQILNSRATDK